MNPKQHTASDIQEEATLPKKQAYLTYNQLAERYGVTRQTLYRWVKEKNLPKPKVLGDATPRWNLSELEAWEAAR